MPGCARHRLLRAARRQEGTRNRRPQVPEGFLHGETGNVIALKAACITCDLTKDGDEQG